VKTEEKLAVAGTLIIATGIGAYIVLAKKVGPTPGEGLAEITAVDAPTSAASGETITITVTLKNVGDGAGSLYAYIKDTDTGALVAAKTYTTSLDPNATAQIQWILTMPNKDWHLTIWGGHVGP